MKTTCNKLITINQRHNKLWRHIFLGGVTCLALTSTLRAGPCDNWDDLVSPGFTSKVSITCAGYWKVITSNGIPDHDIGIFPITGCGRPTAIKEQDYTFVMPAYSSEGILWDSSTVFPLPTPPFIGKPEVAFGVAVNGVPFDPAAAEWWDPATGARVSYPTSWTINPLRYDGMKYDLDTNNGHVQPDGAYHYHGYPYGLYNKIKDEQAAAVLPDGKPDNVTRGRSEIVLLGWAFDGNPIYGEKCGVSGAVVQAKSSWKVRTAASIPPARTAASVPSTSSYPLADFLEDYTYDEALFDGDKTHQLDECNGHRGATPEFPNKIYHYHILEKTNSAADIGFPYIGRCYRLFTYRTGPNIFPKETP